MKKINLNKIIESLKQKELECGQFSEEEKARFLYIELGKKLSFDEGIHSIFGIVQEEAYWKDYNINYEEDIDNKWCCKGMSNAYVALLIKAGISAKSIISYGAKADDNIPHKYVEISFKNGRKIITDFTLDAGRIQCGAKTLDYGSLGEEQHYVYTEDEIRALDNKIGYCYKDGKYLDEYLKELREKLENFTDLEEYFASQTDMKSKPQKQDLIGYKFYLIQKYFSLKNSGQYEGNVILKEIYKGIFTEEEKARIFVNKYSAERCYIGGTKIVDEHRIISPETLTEYLWCRSDGKAIRYIYKKGDNLKEVSQEEFREELDMKPYRKYRVSRRSMEDSLEL